MLAPRAFEGPWRSKFPGWTRLNLRKIHLRGALWGTEGGRTCSGLQGVYSNCRHHALPPSYRRVRYRRYMSCWHGAPTWNFRATVARFRCRSGVDISGGFAPVP